ncbi:HEAT repeat domain-containing protein [Massilia sp. Dwa41.01b]|uniref:HEAT repeat domain-containing protein n=1 Tax=Massilia sp. Dwa41.01b TaxID=2709302 RepID=UPI001AEEC760|nr:HEAT repeat domain-containing protein [Massilia sp. Dwa41.01b]
MDPLILAGGGVVPILEKEVMDPKMPNRRYAIGALGNIRHRSSIPVLTRLAKMESEEDFIRCDSLIAIGMIDDREGLRVLNSVKGSGLQCFPDATNESSYRQWLRLSAPERTFFEALLGWHS